jgi:hypothetical protein
MKKLKIIVFLLCLTGKVMSQTSPPGSAAPAPPPVSVVVTTPPPPPNSNRTWQSFCLGLQIEPLLSWGNAKDNTIMSSGVKFGYGGGIMGDFYFARNYALNIGLTFINEGAEISYDSMTVFKISPKIDTFAKGTKVNYKLQEVEIPIDFKLKTDQIGYLSYYGQFGAMLSADIGTKADFTSPVSSQNLSDQKLSDNINLFNIGLLIGLGVEYNISGHTNLMAGLSYVNNFTNFTGKPANAAVNHISLNLGVFF